MNGWIKLPRSIINHWLWQDAEFLKWWCDLLFLAAYTERKQLAGKQLVTLKVGQLVASTSYLCQRWKRSRPMVERFINLLIQEGLLRKEMSHNIAMLTITNCAYLDADLNTDKQRGNGKIDNTNDAHLNADLYAHPYADLYATNNKENKEYKENKEEKNTLTCIQKPKDVAEKNIVPPTLDMVRARCLAMHYTFDPEAFHAYYETRGWMLNNRKKMKDWWSACVTWQKNDNQRRKNNPSENNEDKNEQIIRQTYEILNENKARAEAGYYDDTRLPF